jgi:hypothetical protein
VPASPSVAATARAVSAPSVTTVPAELEAGVAELERRDLHPARAVGAELYEQPLHGERRGGEPHALQLERGVLRLDLRGAERAHQPMPPAQEAARDAQVDLGPGERDRRGLDPAAGVEEEAHDDELQRVRGERVEADLLGAGEEHAALDRALAELHPIGVALFVRELYDEAVGGEARGFDPHRGEQSTSARQQPVADGREHDVLGVAADEHVRVRQAHVARPDLEQRLVGRRHARVAELGRLARHDPVGVGHDAQQRDVDPADGVAQVLAPAAPGRGR